VGLAAHVITRLSPGSLLNPITLHVVIVVFVATLIRSALGFGEALFAVPLLALRLPLAVAAPLAVLISITIAAIVVVQDWQKFVIVPYQMAARAGTARLRQGGSHISG